jgi:solute:Na+ symporter, SSS family
MKALSLTSLDLIIIVALVGFQLLLGIWVSLKNRGQENYFAGGRSLKWYTIAGSVFGTNISALQLVGMLGIGFSVGFAQSHFEFLAIFAILAMAFILVPLYRKIKIFTVSEFLEIRFNSAVRLTYAIMVILLLLVQMVASFYIGARAIALLTLGSAFPISYELAIIIPAIVVCTYTLLGGLKAVMITESFQTIFIILAASLLFFLTFSQPEIGGIRALVSLDMHLYLPSSHPDLPWTGVFTGLMILNFFYWNSNQLIVQRVIAAETDRDAQLGMIGAGFLKLLIPFLTISTGVAAAKLFHIRYTGLEILPDDAFLYLVDTVVPKNFGLAGLILAGVAAAVFSTIDAMMNTTTTLFTMDIYKKYIYSTASERDILKAGRIAVFAMAILASFLALKTYDPSGSGNFFLTVASRGSYFTTGIIVAFFGGIFSKKASVSGALFAIISAPVFGVGTEFIYQNFLAEIPVFRNYFGENLNFLHRVFVSTILSFLVFWVFRQKEEKESALIISEEKLRNLVSILSIWVFIQVILVLLVINGVVTPAWAAIVGSVFTLIFGIWKSRMDSISSIFGSLLAGITVFLLYYFW